MRSQSAELTLLPKLIWRGSPADQAAYVKTKTSLHTYYNLHIPYSGPHFHADPLDSRRSDLPSVEGFCIFGCNV